MLVGHFLSRRLRTGDAGIANENVDASLFLQDARSGGVDLSGIGDVHFDEVGLIALARQD